MLDPHIPLPAFNSATKYPSIPTYHPLGDRGVLQPHQDGFFESLRSYTVSEKLDGTNVRIITLPALHRGDTGDYFIGTRENLVHARGDRVFNPDQGAVEGVRYLADRYIDHPQRWGKGLVIYGELYGGRINAAGNYTDDPNKTAFRVFDVMVMDAKFHATLSTGDPRKIAAWRDGLESGVLGQTFLNTIELDKFCAEFGFTQVPNLTSDGQDLLPWSIDDTAKWLRRRLDKTKASITEKNHGTPEGVVVRAPDRSRIYKIRFEDYDRTLKQGRFAPKINRPRGSQAQ